MNKMEAELKSSKNAENLTFHNKIFVKFSEKIQKWIEFSILELLFQTPSKVSKRQTYLHNIQTPTK